MAENNPLPTTQRAYTLRLRGADLHDHSWRDALWATHEAVNKGAKAFGDWLLTLRGGLNHNLAKDDPERRPLLALSWLSVESSPKPGDRSEMLAIVGGRNNVVASLRDILSKRGITGQELENWIKDCTPSLTAEIRPGAEWVNRSQAFDDACKKAGASLTREEVWDVLAPFFASEAAYFAPPKTENEEGSGSDGEEKAKDLVQKAGGWLSSRFGQGKGADFDRMAKVYEVIAGWAERAQPFASGSAAVESLAKSLGNFEPLPNNTEGILKLISGPGYKSATQNIIYALEKPQEGVNKDDLTKIRDAAAADCQKCKGKTGNKGRRPWSDRLLEEVELACGFTYLQNDGAARHQEFSVMLDHAARRVSIAHSWIKRAEAQRRKFAEDAQRIASVPPQATAWLDRYCKARFATTGSIDGYRIRRRAIEGWKELVTKWSRATCKTAKDRIDAARELQNDPEIDKPGDIQLFESLAEDDAVAVWVLNGKPDPQPLIDYVAATDAQAKRQRFKVPAYRHPDPLAHPIFCDFGNSRWDIRFDIHQQHKTKDKRNKNATAAFHPRGLSLSLWDGTVIRDDIPIRWGCNRLVSDFGLTVNPGGPVFDVTRADRAGRAVAGADFHANVNIVGLFDQKDWNGRLQAPRRELDAIARHFRDKGGKWDEKAKRMRRHLHWLVTFSAKLRPQGPWMDYAARFSDGDPAKPFVSRKGEFAVKHQDNDSRKGLSKLMLCRLPGLRVLSVDLGHRFAAACAVWHALSKSEFEKDFADARAKGWRADIHDLHATIKQPERETNKPTKKARMEGKVKKFQATTCYRRTSSDMWARLDRQFLIKLQGEEKPARAASMHEMQSVCTLESELGYNRIKDANPLPRPVDELMSDAVRTARLALRRHGDYSRIAWGLMADHKTMPGGNKDHFAPQPNDSPRQIQERREKHVAHLQDILLLWHGLANSDDWKDEWAMQQWKSHVAALSGYQEPSLPNEDATGPERRKQREQMRESLKPLAETLATHGRISLGLLWKQRWEERDPKWTDRLKWLRGWLLPRGLAKPKKSETEQQRQQRLSGRAAARHVGGLSLTRIATIRSLWQVYKAFRYRPRPEDTRAGVALIEKDAAEGRKFGDRMLETMEHMREQRVKQLASRIIEAAIGIGSENRKEHWEDGTKRPRRRIDDPRFAPCHAVVIENLTNYRPEETRTRRENRQLMNWSSSKVKKYLGEGCRLHGLNLREVSAAYTSRQDSRTGLPGIRCADVPVNQFLTARHWQARVKQAAAKNDAESQLLGVVAKNLKGKTVLRLPVKGGDIFMSTDGHTLQADLNAAANIGLRALLDPDWPGRWWYIPCHASTGIPVPDKVKGSAAVPLDQSLIVELPKKAKKDKDIVNLWRECSVETLQSCQFKPYDAYWNGVKLRIVQLLRTHNGLI